MPAQAPVRMSKDALLSRHADATWRRKYLDLSYVRAFFGQCVLKPDYKIPDHLNGAFVLSEYGKRIHQQLTTKHKVNAKDARIICFLEFEWLDLLIDVDATNVDTLIQSLSQEILQRRIFFPNRYGRELYDKAAQRSLEESPILGYTDSVELLKDATIGVYQLGNLVVGPFGVLRSKQKRWLAPSRHVPLYHCSELTCDHVHSTYFSTDDSSEILERRDITAILNEHSELPSDWSQFTRELLDEEQQIFDDKSKSSLHFLLGDAFSAQELDALYQQLNAGAGAETGSLRFSSVDDAPLQAKAELLHGILLDCDDAIAKSLDHLIQEEAIVIPRGEVRRPVLNRGIGTGSYQLQPRASSLGLRFTSRIMSLAPLKLRRLVDSLYLLDDNSDVAELEWQLRGTLETDLGARIDQFLAQTPPDQVVRRLVLGRRTNLVATCQELGIEEDLYRNDDEFVQLTLWKLGFDFQQDEDVNQEFWMYHREMKRALVSAGSSAVIDEDAIRRVTLSYFRALEGVLIDALKYTTWALSADHLASPTPFVYRPETDGTTAYLELTEFARRHEDLLKRRLSYVDDRTTLYPLCRGFEVLSKLLTAVVEEAHDLQRSESDLPKSARHSTLTIFPFQHRRMFLDLSEASQLAILTLLERTSDHLLSGDVSDVRNKWSHYRRANVSIDELAGCLGNIEVAINGMEDAGLCRVLYSYSSSRTDNWDKTVFELQDSRGRSITLERPSRYDWAQMPVLYQPQYLMPVAQVYGHGEFLRFRAQVSSAFSEMWADYPTRRRAGRANSGLLATSVPESTN